MKLVIAEKPSVGAAIAAVMGANEKRSGYFEGGGYLVSWCIGHLISLADAATYNEQFRKWKYDDLPIVPQEWQFIVASGKEQQFSILKDLMHRSDVTEIINACDSGREGELIFRFVYEQANCKKPFSRLWISSMEASAIREGFSNLKDGRGYDNLYQSALCRAKADWLIGIMSMKRLRRFSLAAAIPLPQRAGRRFARVGARLKDYPAPRPGNRTRTQSRKRFYPRLPRGRPLTIRQRRSPNVTRSPQRHLPKIRYFRLWRVRERRTRRRTRSAKG